MKIFAIAVVLTSCLLFVKSFQNRKAASFNALVTHYLVNPEMIVDPSFNLAILSGTIATTSAVSAKFFQKKRASFLSVSLIFSFLSFYVNEKTLTVRFKFDDKAFSLVKVDGSPIGSHPLLGGEYAWEYPQIVNFQFLPNDEFPTFLYFKETTTPVENIIEPPIVIDNLAGQSHFFPLIGNPRQVKSNFLEHRCPQLERNVKLQSDLTLFVKGLQLI